MGIPHFLLLYYGLLLQNDFLNSDFEINPAVWLLSLIFCGLPILIALLLLGDFRRRLRKRKDPFSNQQPPATEESTTPPDQHQD